MDQVLKPTPIINDPQPEVAPPEAVVPITPPPASTPKPKSLLLPILLTTLITTVLLIGGYFGYQYWLKNKTYYCTQELITCPDGSLVGRSGPDCKYGSCPGIPNPNHAATTPNPTADWQTYTNSAYGYSLQHPQNLSLSETNGFEDSKLITGEKIQQILLENDDFSVNIYFEGGFDHGFDPWEVDSQESITIDNKLATKTVFTTSESDRLWIIYTINDFHSFRVEVSTDLSSQTIVDQILSTIQFFDPSPSPTGTTSSSKTYSNSKYGLSFTYPSTSKILGDLNSSIFTIENNGQVVSVNFLRQDINQSIDETFLKLISPSDPNSIVQYVSISDYPTHNNCKKYVQDSTYFNQQPGGLNNILCNISISEYSVRFQFPNGSDNLANQILSTATFANN